MNLRRGVWSYLVLSFLSVLFGPLLGCASSKEGIRAQDKLQVEQGSEKSFQNLQEEEQQHGR